MKIPRFYAPIELSVGETMVLPDSVYRHAIQVLRLKIDEVLILFNGQGGEYLARLTTIEKRRAQVSIEQFDPIERESPLRLTLVQSLIKPDKMDWCIQKSVELGVQAIRPIITARSVVKLKGDKLEKKYQHWQGVMIAACEQSGRTRLPLLLPILSLEDWLLNEQSPHDASQQTITPLRLMMLPRMKTTLRDLSAQQQNPEMIELLVGAEGGFTDEEVALCLQHKVQAITFGRRILRAETAALAGLSLVQYHWGDL